MASLYGILPGDLKDGSAADRDRLDPGPAARRAAAAARPGQRAPLSGRSSQGICRCGRRPVRRRPPPVRERVVLRLSELMRRSAEPDATFSALPRDPISRRPDARLAQGPALAISSQPFPVPPSTDGAAFVDDALKKRRRGDPGRPRRRPAGARSRHRRSARRQSAAARGADGSPPSPVCSRRRHRRRDRHQRQVLDGAFRAPDLGDDGLQRPRASARWVSSRPVSYATAA
jgi:hypothetical protein